MKKIVLKTSILSLATAVALSTAGCGSSDSTTEQPTVTSINGGVADGYLVNATICLDLSKDGYCQVGDEPATYTKEDGTFTLTVSDAMKAAYPDYAKAPLLAYGGYDIDTGADFVGKLQAPYSATAVYVNPVSTLVQNVMSSGAGMAQAEAQTLVKKMLGLPETTDLNVDPVEQAKTDPALYSAALQVQKTLEVLAAAKSSSTNATVDSLYKDLAAKAVAQKDTPLTLKTAVDAVVDGDNNITDKTATKASSTLIAEQVKTLVGTTPIADTTVVGTKVSAVQEAVESGETNATVISNIVASDFSLLHAKEILKSVAYTDDASATMATNVQRVLKDAGMTELALLPLSTEITVLKSDAETATIGVKLELKRDATTIAAEKAKLEVEAIEAAKIAKLEAELLAATEAEKAAIEAELEAAKEKAIADAAVAEKVEADRLVAAETAATVVATAARITALKSAAATAITAIETSKTDAVARSLSDSNHPIISI